MVEVHVEPALQNVYEGTMSGFLCKKERVFVNDVNQLLFDVLQ